MGEGNFKQIIRPSILAISVVFALTGLTACNSTTQPGSNSSPAAPATTGLVATSGINPFTTTGASPTPTPVPTSYQPVIQVPLRSVGFTTPITVNVKALNTLQVVFVPKTQDSDIAGTSIAPQYSQFSIAMTVGIDEQVTPLIPNGAQTGVPAAQSQIFDFSGDITGDCDGTDPTCRDNVTITVTQPQYDYWWFSEHTYCFYPANAASFCTYYTDVYYDHPWNGMLYIQTDDTEPMPTIIPGSTG